LTHMSMYFQELVDELSMTEFNSNVA
jgi:hypothetical protein